MLRSTVELRWTAQIAYAIGLIVTDGNLSPDGRHLSFTSKDLALAKIFRRALGLHGSIGRKGNGANPLLKKYYVVQFGDKRFYKFLLQLGIMPNKTKRLQAIDLPGKYFFHFLRGHFDGDGSSYAYYDKRWPDSFLVYLEFCSASQPHVVWLREMISEQLGLKGHISKSRNNSAYKLRYAKSEATILVESLYKAKGVYYLPRKYLKLKKAFAILGKHI